MKQQKLESKKSAVGGSESGPADAKGKSKPDLATDGDLGGDAEEGEEEEHKENDPEQEA